MEVTVSGIFNQYCFESNQCTSSTYYVFDDAELSLFGSEASEFSSAQVKQTTEATVSITGTHSGLTFSSLNHSKSTRDL